MDKINTGTCKCPNVFTFFMLTVHAFKIYKLKQLEEYNGCKNILGNMNWSGAC